MSSMSPVNGAAGVTAVQVMFFNFKRIRFAEDSRVAKWVKLLQETGMETWWRK